jgi:ribosomal protein L22
MAEGARDAGKKVDQPSEQAGSGTDAKEELQTQEAAQAVAEEQATEAAEAPKPKPKRKPAAKKAEATAAAETGVDKEGAEAATAEGTSEPVAETEAPAEDKPKPRRRSRKAAEPEEAPKPRRKRDAGDRVTVRAHAKYVRTSARKARLVADHVKGKDVAEARALLAFSPRSVAEDWRKLLESAIANAEHNHDLVGEELRVLNATADEGPTLKRFRPRAMGRATRIRKRTSHLTITLTPKEN